MKKIFRKIIALLWALPKKLEVCKTKIFEGRAKKKRKHLYRDLQWTTEQKDAFDAYWKRVYGKTIHPHWHKLYQSFNGAFCADYFPDALYSTCIEPAMNSYVHSKILADKNMLDTLFANRVDGVRPPHTYVCATGGAYFDANKEPIAFQTGIKMLWDIGDAVVKPTTDSSSGRNVEILHIKDGKNTLTGESIEQICLRYKDNFVVQEKIGAHPILKTLYPKAINTFRVITYSVENEIKVAPISLRIGSGGGQVDNIHAGGMVLGVTHEGVCRARAYALGNCDKKDSFTKHPDTGVVFEGYEIPQIERICNAAKKLHVYLSKLNIVSWDFTLNDQDEIIVVEANCWGQSVWFPQIVNECSFFGEDTAYILDKYGK